MTFLVRIVSTVLGIGYAPLAPGTWASAAGILLAWFLPSGTGYLLIALSVAGFWACKPAREIFKKDDPGIFVMDELCGVLLSTLWLPKTIPVYAAAFFLFRLFDIWKPGPIRSVQNSPHPWSIMCDDLAAGLFANGALQILMRTVWHAV